ncbi:hypothetical protein RHSIM_Rhsim05G0045500 [Rhododendron simsii]|uniref:Uncharacterized protein n=1 Tax=Rhododendron simsii TaxID=118357 RepID=A0A834LQU3_RHOSS|nr:hypothetical protein RHSIM_Rhsim05G0045500 [Rhododendron simsii]
MYNLDLRLVLPALINLTLFLLQPHQAGNPTNLNIKMNMNLNSWFFFIVVIILFLTTSVQLPLSVTAERIRVRPGDFSFSVAILLLGSNHGQDETETGPPQVVVVADDRIGSGNQIFLDQPTSEPDTILVVEP